MFGGIKIVAYLQSTSLELFGEGIDNSEIAIFPEKTIHNVIVKDEEKLKQTIIDFLAKSGLRKQKVVVVLGEGALYEKAIRFTTKEAAKKEAEAFFASVPIEPIKLAKTTLTNDKEVYFIATNKELYKVVAEAFLAVGWNLESVVPITLFGYEDKKLSRDRAKQVLKDTSLLKLGNFLLENPVDFSKIPSLQVTEEKPVTTKEKEVKEIVVEKKIEPKEEEKVVPEKEDTWDTQDGNGRKRTYIFYPLLAIFFGVTFYLLLHFHIIYIPLLQKDDIHTVTLTPSATQTPSPTSVPIKKEDLKLQVQNGTGTPGQAKLVKDSLSALGYKTIDTANAENSDNSDTLLTVGPGVSKDVQDEITKTLQKSFKTVVTKTTTDKGSYDIIITTGTSL